MIWQSSRWYLKIFGLNPVVSFNKKWPKGSPNIHSICWFLSRLDESKGFGVGFVGATWVVLAEVAWPTRGRLLLHVWFRWLFGPPKLGQQKSRKSWLVREPRFTRFRSCEMLEKFPEVCEKKSGGWQLGLWFYGRWGMVVLGNWWRWKLSSDWAVSEMSRNESLLKLQYWLLHNKLPEVDSLLSADCGVQLIWAESQQYHDMADILHDIK